MGGLLGDHHNLAVFRPTVLEQDNLLTNEQDAATFAELIERRRATLQGAALAECRRGHAVHGAVPRRTRHHLPLT